MGTLPGSLRACQGPTTTWATYCYLSRCIPKKLDQKQNSKDLNKRSDMGNQHNMQWVNLPHHNVGYLMSFLMTSVLSAE